MWYENIAKLIANEIPIKTFESKVSTKLVTKEPSVMPKMHKNRKQKFINDLIFIINDLYLFMYF